MTGGAPPHEQEDELLTDQHRAMLPALASQVAPRTGGQVPAATLTALLRAIERIEDLLEEETCALKTHQVVDLVAFIRRKSQGLLELTRAARAVSGYAVGPAIIDRLQGLKEKLQRNQAVLQLHLEAVREVAEVLTKAARDAESDGTYSMPPHWRDNNG